MKLAFGLVLALHAGLHLIGFVKGFDLARVTQLTSPISRSMACVWLTGAVLLLAATIALFAAPRWFWVLAFAGVLTSQVAIAAAWHDARFGTALNVIVLLVGVYGAFAWGPFGLRAEYEARTAQHLAQLAKAPLVTEADLGRLPAPLQRYLRYVGVVGHPQVRGFRVRFTGRIRSGPTAAWMAFTGEQHNFTSPATRLFWMRATLHGLPVDALHAYDEGSARMRVKLLSLFPVVDAGGKDFTRTETVTLFNDLCILAPATLIDPTIRWQELDSRNVEGTFTNGAHTIRGVLQFDDAGALVNFWSDDRPSLAPDGVTFVPQRWSTPVGGYRAAGPFKLASRGEGRYAAATGEYPYIQFVGLEVSYDLTAH